MLVYKVMRNTKLFIYIIPLLFFTFVIACQSIDDENQMPNVILIMADDIGYEGLSINGSTSYNTPFLDSLALNGINFTNTLSQPLCTPSRVKIMTGKYNFRNYEHFSYLDSNQKTFGNLFKENGYKTAIVGKWQLNGLRIGDVDRKIANDNTRPYKFGFDEYSLWQLTKPKQNGERFANPLIEQNGNFLPRDENSYGPDIVSDYAVEFIKRNKDNPFFIYYPMLLVHDPFVPTPDSPEWSSLETRSTPDTRYFIDMVNYMDKIVGKIINELKQQDIFENCISKKTSTDVISQPFYIYPRSSIGKTPLRLANSVGIIDAQYRGNLIVQVDNISSESYTIQKGQRLFQICSQDLTPFRSVKIVDSLLNTLRGAKGIGSTGK